MPKKHVKLDRKKGLYLKAAGIKGRGVFCTTSIARGEVLEVTPAVILNEAATNHIDKTILVDYIFELGRLSKRLRERARIRNAEGTGSSSVIMGLASFCNHAEHPNAEILWEEKNGTLYHTLKATRAIPKHTEICTTYGDGWFEGQGVKNWCARRNSAITE